MTALTISKVAYCNDCEVELTEDNTQAYGGFDGSNYLSARQVGLHFSKDEFTKCDSCFDGDNDRYLDKLYE